MKDLLQPLTQLLALAALLVVLLTVTLLPGDDDGLASFALLCTAIAAAVSGRSAGGDE